MPKLRLVKVIVHPIFVVDDGENLTEFQNEPSVISAAELADFPDRLKRDASAIEEDLNRE